MRTIAAIGASPGIAIGSIHVLATAEIAVPDALESLTAGGDRLHKAIGAMIRAEPIAP